MIPTNPIRERTTPVVPTAPSPVSPGSATWVGYSLGENRGVARRLSGNRSQHAIVVLGLLAGAVLSLRFGGEPTGHRWVDAGYLVVFGALVSVGAQFAGRFARVLALAPCILLPGVWLVLGALAAALVVGATFRPSTHRVMSFFAGILLVISYLHLGDSLGNTSGIGIPRMSAAAAGFGLVLLVWSSIRNTTGRIRGALEIVTMSVLFILVLGAVNLAAVMYRAKPDLENAAAAIERSLGATDVRSIDSAASDIVAARRYVVAARRTIESTWAGTGRLVPIAAQNYDALVRSLDAIERSTIAAARTVDAADVGAIRSETGGVDVAALQQAKASAREFRDVLDASASVFASQQGPWLLPPLLDELADGADRSRNAIIEIDAQLPRLEILPQLLGADGPRNYLVIVANPSETRDLGGFAGGFAVIEFDEGQIELVQSGRTTELSAIDMPTIDGPLPDRFRDYEPWTYAQNYTGTPDLTVAAHTLREVFPAMGGRTIDGVVYLDPFALGALTDLTGPITIDALGLRLDGDTLPQFLLVDQYALIDDRTARTSVLDVVAAEVFEQFQFGGLPSMSEMIDKMSPMVAQGRLRMVTFDETETSVLEDLGLTERFRQESFDDFLAVMHSNGGPNKLDPYLHRTVDYEVTLGANEVAAVLKVGLENRAPEGLSDYVTNNRWNLERATNRMLLIVHSPLDVSAASVDGNLVTVDSYYEYGLWRHEMFVSVPRGAAVEVELELVGRFGVGMVDADPATHELWVHHQPTVNDDNYRISVNGDSESLVLAESTRLRWPD